MLMPKSSHGLTESGPLGWPWDLCLWRFLRGFSCVWLEARARFPCRWLGWKISSHSRAQAQSIPLVRCHCRKGLQEPSGKTASSALLE